MNTLSIYIYLIQILGYASLIISSLGIIAFAASLFLGILCLMDSGSSKEDKEMNSRISGIAGKLFISSLILGVLTVFTPTRETMILIAASEVGEQVIKSEQVSTTTNNAIELLNTYMKEEIKNLTKEDK